ncbi:MAG: peptidylprolyl isomerase, partial [Verrucomicrobiota bacterium]
MTPKVRLETSAGSILLELDREKAPATVENFLGYVEDGFYENTVFHRVMEGFMIQGGGFGLQDGGQIRQKETKSPIQNEAKNGLQNARGTIAMARTPDPHSATAQFFINHGDNSNLDYPSGDGWGYAVFGKVIE